MIIPRPWTFNYGNAGRHSVERISCSSVVAAYAEGRDGHIDQGNPGQSRAVAGPEVWSCLSSIGSRRFKRDPAMQTKFGIFGPVHIAILSTIPVLAAILAAIERWISTGRRGLRIGLAITLLLNSIVRYGYLAARGWLTFPYHLPLDLCDATLCLMIVALLTLNATIFELAYYGALAGTSMALLTPDLWEPFPSFSTV